MQRNWSQRKARRFVTTTISCDVPLERGLRHVYHQLGKDSPARQHSALCRSQPRPPARSETANSEKISSPHRSRRNSQCFCDMPGPALAVIGHYWFAMGHPVFVCARDRKSTRLNSSHVSISYAVFCLKKKKSKVIAFGH